MTSKKPVTPEVLLEVTTLGAVQLSPDGRTVVYQTIQPVLAENLHRSDLWLVAADGASQPVQLTNHDLFGGYPVHLAPRFSPDSRTIAYFSYADKGPVIRLIDLAGNDVAVLRHESMRAGMLADDASISSFAWSPNGEEIAFIAAESREPASKPMAGIEIDILKGPDIASQAPLPRSVLAAINVASGEVRLVTDRALHVMDFSWSPDGARLAVVATGSPGPKSYMFGRLLTVDAATGRATTVVDELGLKSDPAWSPDGDRIAYVGTSGEDWMYVTTPKVVDLATGDVVDLLDRHRDAGIFPSGWGGSGLTWADDGHRLLYTAPHRMGSGIFAVEATGESWDAIAPLEGAWLSNVSLSGDRLAFARESTAEPPEVYVSEIWAWGPRRLTNLNPSWDYVQRPEVERISYPSSDGRFDIDALLVLPPARRDAERLPLVVEVTGGPVMVQGSFAASLHYPVLALAAAGYAVLVPNTRGRGLGYPESFTRAVEHEQSAYVKPFSDVLAGVEHLVTEGTADSDRLGICGHSYGGTVSALGITLTDRFRAAAVHDCGGDMLAQAFLVAGDPSMLELHRQMGGLGSPFNEGEIDHTMRESPLHNFARAKTPILLEFADNTPSSTEGQALAHAAAAIGIPYEYVIYPRQGHVMTEPVMTLDSNRRVIAWFDYWLRDLPYQDDARQERYDSWKER